MVQGTTFSQPPAGQLFGHRQDVVLSERSIRNVGAGGFSGLELGCHWMSSMGFQRA
jgi:hypothetical protein